MAKATAGRKKMDLMLAKRHTGHEEHLCAVVSRREIEKAANLAKGAKYICYICGRAAAKAKNLCEPVEI
jgi:hypothetical protein